MAEIRDAITATLTPFGDDGAVDYGYIWRHLRFQEDNGIAGVAPCGTNGEGQSLALEERKEIIRFVIENKGGLFVMPGTGCVNLPETIELTRFAERLGADAVLVLPPYFMKPSQAGLRDYFRRLFDAVRIPILLYHIPSLTGVEITHELLRDLSDYPNLLGVKDTSGDLGHIKGYVEAFPNLKIFSGADELIVDALNVGVAGIISGTSNVFPELIARIYRESRAGRDVSGLMEKLTSIISTLTKYPVFACNKAALSHLGFPLAHVRPPLIDLAPDQLRTLGEEIGRIADY